MLTRQRKHLRVGGGAEAGKHHADDQQQVIITVPGEQREPQRTQHAAEEDQRFAVASFIRTAGEKLADQNADHRAAGKEQPDQRRPYLDLGFQKQAQRRGLQGAGDAGKKRHRQKASEVRSGARRVTADEVGMVVENSSKRKVARIIRPLK